MKYTALKLEYENKLNKLSDEVGLFWAFNRSQFDEGMKKNPSKKYTSIGMGGYLPSENVGKYIQGTKTLSKWYKEAKKTVKKEEAILYELYNYECFYTGDITNAYEALSDSYTKEEVLQVYYNHKNEAQASL